MAIWKHLQKYKKFDVKKGERNISEQMEKGDARAVMLAAIFTLWLPAALLLLALGALALWAFGVF